MLRQPAVRGVPPRAFSRRDALRLLGTSAVGIALGGCATGGRAAGRADPASLRALGGPFHAPDVRADLVVRTIVGLRPYRAEGFVVRGERLGEKTLIHNYGHGGGGISLSWGSSALAVREAPDLLVRRAAVLGSGVMGLTTARLLQQRGWDVTIYTRDLPPHTTSNIAGGQWVPTSVYDEDEVGPAFVSQYREASRIAHHAFAGLVGPRYGVRWMENYYLRDFDAGAPEHALDMPELFHAATMLGPGEHPFPVPRVFRMVTMMVEPAVLLDRLLSEVREAGGSVVVREFGDPAEVAALPEPVVFNCTGLGAATLFGDDALTPVRGQLEILPPDPRVDFATLGGGRGTLYMFPRPDGILLGGTFDRGDADRRPRAEDRERIVAEHRRIFGGMRGERARAG